MSRVIQIRRVRVLPILVVALACTLGARSAFAAPALVPQESAPASRPPRGVRVIIEHGLRVTVDERAAVWWVDTPDMEAGVGLDCAERDWDRPDAPLAGTWPRWQPGGADWRLPGTAQLLAIAKAFDDDLMATLQRVADGGIPGALVGRRELIARLATAVRTGRPKVALPAVAMLEAAQHVMGLPAGSAWTDPVRSVAALAAFDADVAHSKVTGFCGDVPDLAPVFRRVRLLTPTARAAFEPRAWQPPVRAALLADTALRDAYARLMTLDRTLDNAFTEPSLLDAPATRAAFFPHTRSHETDLLAAERRRGEAHPDEDVMERLIPAIRSGALSLTPRADSGWYDHQAAALEPLVREAAAPESRRARRTDNYQRYCDLLFKVALSQNREGRGLRGGIGAGTGSGPQPILVELEPVLRVEPHITVYRRIADSYGWLRGALTAVLGADTMHAQRLQGTDGRVGGALSDELLRMERQFRCLAVMACDDLNCDRSLAGAGLSDADLALMSASAPEVLAGMLAGPDATRDVRTIVPVDYNPTTRLWRCWAVVGVTSTPFEFSYAERPVVTWEYADADASPRREVVVRLARLSRSIHHAIWLSCEVREPLSRAEMRRLCDEGRTVEGIQQRLDRLK